MKRELLQTEAQRKLSGRIAMLLTAGLSFASPAIAQEEIDVSIVSGFSPAVAAVKMLEESFMPGVDARLAETGNYTINWQEAFSGTLAKPAGELEAIQTGLADMGVIPTGFHADKLPIYQRGSVSYTHLRAQETPEHLVCSLQLEKKKRYKRHTRIH